MSSQFIDYATTALGASHETARNFMRVFEQSRNQNYFDYEIAQTVLYLLSSPSVPEEKREEAVEKIQSGEIKSVANTKAFLLQRDTWSAPHQRR